VCSRCPSILSSSPFYRLKEVGLHVWGSVRSSTSPPVVRGRTVGLPYPRALWGMVQVMVIVLANPSAHARSASLSCSTSQRCGDSCRSAQNPTSDELRHQGCGRRRPGFGRGSYCVRGSLPMPPECPAREKGTRSRQHSGGRRQASLHRALQTRPALGTAAQ